MRGAGADGHRSSEEPWEFRPSEGAPLSGLGDRATCEGGAGV